MSAGVGLTADTSRGLCVQWASECGRDESLIHGTTVDAFALCTCVSTDESAHWEPSMCMQGDHLISVSVGCGAAPTKGDKFPTTCAVKGRFKVLCCERCSCGTVGEDTLDSMFEQVESPERSWVSCIESVCEQQALFHSTPNNVMSEDTRCKCFVMCEESSEALGAGVKKVEWHGEVPSQSTV